MVRQEHLPKPPATVLRSPEATRPFCAWPEDREEPPPPVPGPPPPAWLLGGLPQGRGFLLARRSGSDFLRVGGIQLVLPSGG